MYINLKMLKSLKNITVLFILSILFANTPVKSEIIDKIEIIGNERISSETITMFSTISLNEKIDDKKINRVLKNLYETNFFENVSVKLEKNSLIITVKEYPIIENIFFQGLKAKRNKEAIKQNLILKNRSSFNEFFLEKDKNTMNSTLKDLGYYFSSIDTFVEYLENNKVNITYNIELGDKAKIKKISFIGDKKFKDSKLRGVILSEEYKFWKFISGKKFLNEQLIEIDKRLIKNFYLNKGYYFAEVNTSFAKIIDENSFELIFNVNPNKKIYFNDLSISYPDDFDDGNFDNLKKLLKKSKGKPYSINLVNKILDEIDFITTNDEFRSIKAEVNENVDDDKLNIKFLVKETEKFYVERINIYGNNVTRENVIRNYLEIDEGDIFKKIENKKSENNLKSLNFFKKIESKVIDGEKNNSKIINIYVEEKPTGEISAGAGVGTSGGTLAFSVKENNYLGKGIGVEANATITAESFKGLFSVSNPNYNNSDKSVFANFQATETDRLKNFGYKSNKTGFEIGTGFEYYRDLDLGLSTSSFYEKIETNDTASTRQKSQEGDYWDTFVKLNFDYDKRNQKFKPSEGFRSTYSIQTPIISENNTLTNTYNHKYYTNLFENNVTSFSIFLQSANSITSDDIKLSERLNIPSNKLRGFERGKVGPKDGNYFIGGNYVTSFNATTNIPQLFQNFQNLDLSLFFDAANVWGIDYDSSLNDGSKIRSSIGVGVEWFTVIGPLSFSLAETITKDNTDVTESFRFNIGTTF